VGARARKKQQSARCFAAVFSLFRVGKQRSSEIALVPAISFNRHPGKTAIPKNSTYLQHCQYVNLLFSTTSILPQPLTSREAFATLGRPFMYLPDAALGSRMTF
jgi:hypothetical protein